MSCFYKCNKYNIKKYEIKVQFIEWQNNFNKYCKSWGDIAYWGDYFYKQGKRYGLLKEFRENGIC